ncbi:pentatricopeptide repeat-containing protein At4g14820 [Macadamia integrifolia]|uniref:pentatricopeptide repeat-containing protein At4g14820 n=1 Tax=Macadamia integrifolia TaxID=60698 RepID=UPI001C4F9B53|nr:pentatricopeptide repeat-containing protein At4g14820 [Macadamia integrifolia]
MATINRSPLAFPSRQNPNLNNLRHHHLFSALTSATTLAQLKQIHAQILRSGFDRSTSLLLRLVVSSCALSSSLDYALLVFNQISEPETHICNRVLRELSRSNEPDRTLQLYERMRREGIGIDRFSFPPLLKASARVSALGEGMEIHGLASKMGFDSDPFIETGLVRVYANCGRIFEARLMFDKMSHRDVVIWSIIIDGYCQSGLYEEALLLFDEMKSSGVEPDEMVLATILSACGRAGKLDFGKLVHEYIKDKNVSLDSHLQSALITMYSNCGAMDLAQLLFDEMSPKNLVVSTAMVTAYSKLGKVEVARSVFNQMMEKDLVCWSAMIAGYAESDWPQEGLKLFDEMRAMGIKPDQVTMLSVISSCAQLGAMDQAKWIHTFTDENGFGEILPVNNALIDMYAKCGNLDGARSVFDRMGRRNVVSWTSMITSLAVHGDADNALKLFQRMKDEGIKPNQVTFVGVLYACSHAGLVEKGRQVFASMTEEFNITPKHEHYGCMVDLLGRANLLREALELVEAMPFPPNVVVWGSLLAACRVHGEVELGEFAATRLLELEPDHDGAHVLLSNIYAKANRWDEVGAVRNLMKQRGITKERGWSRIDINSEIHEFVTADRKHRMTDMIYEKLDMIVGELKLVGYAPDACSVLVDLDEEEKKEVVLWHSEKLALCLGLMRVGKGSCIHIVKNLRVCEDCHTFMKLVSKVFEREIIVRDRTRFHHYKCGVCSCKDYW